MDEKTSGKDETMPSGRWEFDAEVTAAFDDMLQRSIPQYDVMRDAVLSVGSTFVKERTEIIDVGCSRGESLAPFVDRFELKTRANGVGPFVERYVGVEVSAPMRAAAGLRFEREIAVGRVEIVGQDLCDGFPFVQASLALSVFTMQFIPIEYRQRVIQDIYDHTVHGGAIILVEKVIGATAPLNKIMVDRYYQMKAANGYTQDAIDRKRLALEGVLVPVTADWNIELLKQAGYRDVDTFWAWMNFRAFVGVKR